MTEIELLDNGVFADATKGDGIYSRYFTGATERERYSVTCEAWDDGYAYYEEGSKKILTGDFRRQENGGSIRVTQFLIAYINFKLKYCESFVMYTFESFC